VRRRSARRAAPTDATFVPARTPGVVSVDADGEAVLVDEAADGLHVLNAPAALLWSCFDGRSSVADISEDLAGGLGAPADQVLHDALDVVQGLRELDLVHDGRGAAPERPVATDDELEAPADRLLHEPPDT
jgi:hypothetical protein